MLCCFKPIVFQHFLLRRQSLRKHLYGVLKQARNSTKKLWVNGMVKTTHQVSNVSEIFLSISVAYLAIISRFNMINHSMGVGLIK